RRVREPGSPSDTAVGIVISSPSIGLARATPCARPPRRTVGHAATARGKGSEVELCLTAGARGPWAEDVPAVLPLVGVLERGVHLAGERVLDLDLDVGVRGVVVEGVLDLQLPLHVEVLRLVVERVVDPRRDGGVADGDVAEVAPHARV